MINQQLDITQVLVVRGRVWNGHIMLTYINTKGEKITITKPITKRTKPAANVHVQPAVELMPWVQQHFDAKHDKVQRKVVVS